MSAIIFNKNGLKRISLMLLAGGLLFCSQALH